MGETRPLAIVLPNGEALWFTTRDIDVDTPRLVIPWSLFQYLAMSKRSLSGFQSWGKVGVVYIRRVAQDIIHGAQQRGSIIMDRIREANRTNPLLMDLQSAYPEPQDAVPPTSASTGAYRPNFNFRDFLQRPSFGEHFQPGEGPPRVGRGPLPCIYDQPTHEMPLAASIGEADHASNCMGMWARKLLGQENPSPPSKGVPPKATPGTTSSTPAAEPTAPTAEPAPEEVEEDDDSDVELTAESGARKLPVTNRLYSGQERQVSARLPAAQGKVGEGCCLFGRASGAHLPCVQNSQVMSSHKICELRFIRPSLLGG